jgi:hypothetical protein
MADDFAVHGADQFLRLSKALKEAGQTGLRKELNKAIRDGVKPVIPKAKKRLEDGLPRAIAKSAVQQVVQVKTGRDPGVSVAVRFGSKRASNAQLANSQGMIRHPVFADGKKTRKEWRWVNQNVPNAKGWFDDTYTAAAPDLRRAIEAAMQAVADRIVREAR